MEVNCGKRSEADYILGAWHRTSDCGIQEKSTALHNAVKYGRTDLVKELLNGRQANFDIPALSSYYTLHLAAEKGLHEIVLMLIGYCAKHSQGDLSSFINAEDNQHLTPLQRACRKGHDQVVRVLLLWKAKLLLEDSTEPQLKCGTRNTSRRYTTPLHLAIKPGDCDGLTGANNLAVVGILLETKESYKMLNTRDSDGNTPLHLAIEMMNLDVTEVLLKQRRLIATEKNNLGKAPAHLLWEKTHNNHASSKESVKIMGKVLLQLDDVREAYETLKSERDRHYRAACSLLVKGALLVNVAFGAVLLRPTIPVEFVSQSPISEVTDEIGQKLYYSFVISLFSGSNNLSFFSAVFTVLEAVRLLIPSPENEFLETAVYRLRAKTRLISLSFTTSTILAAVAFMSFCLASTPVAENFAAKSFSYWYGRTPTLPSNLLPVIMTTGLLIIHFLFSPLVNFSTMRHYLLRNIISADPKFSISREVSLTLAYLGLLPMTHRFTDSSLDFNQSSQHSDIAHHDSHLQTH